MKVVICFYLFFYFCHCIEDSDGSKKSGRREVNGDVFLNDDSNESENYWENVNAGIYRGNVKKHDDHQTHGDYHNTIIKPCSLDNVSCIRRVFARNSKCTPVEGPAPDPYMLQRLDLPIPQANLTFSLLNAQVKGLNEWKIEKFFINKATDRLVLEVVFDRIVVATPGARTTYYRKGKEPIEVTDYSIIEYYGLSFTLTIPNLKDLQLSKGQIFTNVADAAPLYTLGPAVRNNKDPDFIKGISVWLDNLGVTMQEVWATQGPVFMSIFLQSTICDFTHN